MNPIPNDPLLRSLAGLPPVPVDDAVADALRRRARAELVGAGERALRPLSSRLAAAWSDAILPSVLVVSGAAYAWMSVITIGRIFVS
jgi:hypothetical protein